MAAHCAREGARDRGRVYLFRRSCVTALELDRVIKEMNSEYSGPPSPSSFRPPHLLRFASIPDLYNIQFHDLVDRDRLRLLSSRY